LGDTHGPLHKEWLVVVGHQEEAFDFQQPRQFHARHLLWSQFPKLKDHQLGIQGKEIGEDLVLDPDSKRIHVEIQEEA
jgi:hypothetical protein